MKRTARFLSFLTLLAAVFTGCRQEEADYVLPGIRLGGPFTVNDDTKKASYEASPELNVLNLTVAATRDWEAEIAWDADEVPWIAVTPDHGVASDVPQSVTVTILDNAGFNRAKDIKFSINFDYKTLSVSQTGEKGEEIVGTIDNPFTVAGVIKYVKSLGADVQSPQGVYIKGIVSQVKEEFTTNFGNGTFYISDDGTTDSEQFYAFRVMYLGNQKWTSGSEQVKVGDEVWIYGTVVNYKGNTPETVQNNAHVFSHNGAIGGGTDTSHGPVAGSGTTADPYNVASAITLTSTMSASDKLENVYVKGRITRISSIDTGTYGNAEYYIADDGFEGAEFLVYRGYYLGNKHFTSVDQIKAGDEVVIFGTLVNFNGRTQEFTQGNYIYSLNGKTEGGGGGDQPQPGGDVIAVSVAAFNAMPESNTQVYELVGTIGGSVNQDYGNFDLTDETGTVYVYGLTATNNGYGAKNDQSYMSLGLQAGDKIKIHGYRGSFNGKVEVVYAWFIEKMGEGSIVPGGASGTGTLDDPYNALGAANAVKDLTWTSNTEYESTDEVYVKGKISRIASGGTFTEGGTYGNASFYISEDGTEKDEFYCFRVLYLGNKKFEAGQTDIKVGDEVVICGKLMNYKGNTPETVSGKAYLYSLNAQGGGGGGDQPQPGGDVIGVSVAAFNAMPESDTQVYELVGTIGGSVNQTYGNFDLTDDTGTVYVYGLTATNNGYGAKNDQSYMSLGLQAGDKIKIRGYRGSFNGKVEVVYAWFVEKLSEGSIVPGGGSGTGTLADPYTPLGAVNAVKDLTWTSNTEYESTDEVYVKGKISRIASGGTFTEGGTYGNASFYISEDGTEKDEFYCFRVLYLGNKKFEAGQTDIKVGDEVVICGKLMNYKGNTPETVSGKAYLYSLNSGSTPGGGGGGGDTPSGDSVSFATNSGAQTWAAETDGTYGGGFATTTQGLKIGYFKHTGTTAPIAPNANHVRVYKNCVLSIAPADGKKIKKIVLGCAPNAGTTSYCFDMTGLEGGANATCDKSALTVTWTGSASRVVLHANNGQVRVEKITVEFE